MEHPEVPIIESFKTYAPHLLVLKQINDTEMSDISFAVGDVNMTAAVDSFPTMKLDFIPSMVSLVRGILTVTSPKQDVEPETIERANRIFVAEIDHVKVRDATNNNDYRELLNSADIVWMSGVISDVMTSISATSSSISAIVESDLAELDTTLADSLFSIRSTGVSAGPIFVKDASSNKDATGRPATPTDLLVRKYVTKGQNKKVFIEDSNLDTTSTVTPEVEEDKDADERQTDFKEHVVAMSILVGGDANAVDPNGTMVRFRPWQLTRLILVDAMESLIPRSEYAEKLRSISMVDAIEVVDRLKALLYKVHADKSSELIVTRGEFSDLIRSAIINPIISSPIKAPSVWKLATYVMHQFHMYFTPNILSSSEEMDKFGGFRVMNPYRQYTTHFENQHIVSLKSTVPGYKSLIKSVGFETTYNIPGVVGNAPKSWYDSLYLTYKPRIDHYKITGDAKDDVKNLGTEPVFATHKTIVFPSWILPAAQRINRIHKRTVARPEGPPISNPESQEGVEAGGTSNASSEDALAALKNALTIYLRTAWQIFGRLNATSTLSTVYTYKVQPLDVVLISLESHDKDPTKTNIMTGMVSSVNIDWTSGKRYDSIINLSHVTNIYDNYFRAIDTTLDGHGDLDNLNLYLEKNPPKLKAEIE